MCTGRGGLKMSSGRGGGLKNEYREGGGGKNEYREGGGGHKIGKIAGLKPFALPLKTGSNFHDCPF